MKKQRKSPTKSPDQLSSLEMEGSQIQFLQISVAGNPTVQTLNTNRVANIVPGLGGKASLIDVSGNVILTDHAYDEVIDKINMAGLLLDLRN